jgi:hypothetical protein
LWNADEIALCLLIYNQRAVKNVVVRRLRIVYLIAVGALVLSCCGCTYRLYAPNPPSQERIRIVAKYPDRYTLHVEERVPTGRDSADGNALHTHVAHATNYQVPSDGRVTMMIPAFRPTCGVYLFNRIKVGGGGDDALKEWEISVLYEVRTLRTLSLKELKELPTDAEGYRLLKIPD